MKRSHLSFHPVIHYFSSPLFFENVCPKIVLAQLLLSFFSIRRAHEFTEYSEEKTWKPCEKKCRRLFFFGVSHGYQCIFTSEPGVRFLVRRVRKFRQRASIIAEALCDSVAHHIPEKVRIWAGETFFPFRAWIL
jgi:hypothetical protein